MNRLNNLWRSWKSEFSLIDRILSNNYPSKQVYPPSFLEKAVMCSLVLIRSLSLSHIKGLGNTKVARTQIAELYVVGWSVLLFLLLMYQSASPICALIISYRLIDGFNYRLCIIFVDRYSAEWDLRSLNRSFLLLLVNYIELIVGFAALYIFSASICDKDNQAIANVGDALYFSIVTITTLGYGDYAPVDSVGKMLVATQTVAGVVFLAIVLGTFISGIPRISGDKSE